MEDVNPVLSDVTNQVPKRRGGRKSLNLSPEERKKLHAQRQKEYREKKNKAKEEYLQTPEGQAADR